MAGKWMEIDPTRRCAHLLAALESIQPRTSIGQYDMGGFAFPPKIENDEYIYIYFLLDSNEIYMYVPYGQLHLHTRRFFRV